MKWFRGCLIAAGVLLLFLAALIWVVFFKSSRAPFDARQLAESETRMWKAYYARDPLELHGELNLMLHNQFGLSRYRTWQVSSLLALASMDFAASPRPVSDAARLKLVDDLTGAYDGIKAGTGLSFDPREAAEAELAWWVARRTPGENSVEQVGDKIEELYAILYGQTNDLIAKAAQLRAQAAHARDASSDWPEVERLLVASYGALLQGIGR